MLRFVCFHTAERKCHVGTLGFTHFTLSVHLSCPAVTNLSCHCRACHFELFQVLHSKYYIRLIPTHAPSLVTQYITSHFSPTSLPDHSVLCSSSVPVNVFLNIKWSVLESWFWILTSGFKKHYRKTQMWTKMRRSCPCSRCSDLENDALSSSQGGGVLLITIPSMFDF